MEPQSHGREFLSIQAQDFIEDSISRSFTRNTIPFLSIQAQDFIEDVENTD